MKGKLTGQIFTCSSWTSNRDIGFSAVEDVNSHPETITKHSHPNANVNLMTSPMHMGKVADKTNGEAYLSYCLLINFSK